MNHPTAIFTVLFFAIIFLTTSILGGKIGDADRESLMLLVVLGVFALKMSIDDYVGFQKDHDERHLFIALLFSLLMYISLAISIGFAASVEPTSAVVPAENFHSGGLTCEAFQPSVFLRVSEWAFICCLAIGIVWGIYDLVWKREKAQAAKLQGQDGGLSHGNEQLEVGNNAWLFMIVNACLILLLLADIAWLRDCNHSFWIFVGMLIVVCGDFFFLGRSLQNLAALEVADRKRRESGKAA